MANLSNINNKFLVTTGGNVLIGQTAAVGSSLLQVTGNSTFAGDVTLDPAANSDVTLKLHSNSGALGDAYAWNLIAESSGDNYEFSIAQGTTDVLKFNNTAAAGNNNATFAGTVETTTLRTDVINNKANSANIIYRSGTQTLIGGGSSTQKVKIEDGGDAIFGGNVNVGGSVSSPASVGTILGVVGRDGVGAGTAGIVLKDYDNAAWDIWNSGGNLNFRYNNDASVGFGITSLGATTFAGNVGVGMTPDTSWGTNSHIINLGIGNADAGHIGWREKSGADELSVGWNVYHNNTNWYYASNNPANLYTQDNGTHKFQVAAGGTADNIITWTDSLSINSSGDATFAGVIHTTKDGGAVAAISTPRIRLRTDGVIEWGATYDAGTLTWDTNKAVIAAQSGNILELRANNSTLGLTVDTSGYVGIGLTSPGFKLHVVASAPEAVCFDTTNASYGAMNIFKAQGVTKGASGYNSGSMYFGGEAGTNTIIQSGGQNGIFINNSTRNVGIGTATPNAKLEVITSTAGYAGIIRNTNGANDSNGLLVKAGTGATEYALKVSNTNDSTNFMAVKGNGNVGIGTTSPESVLHIKNNGTGPTQLSIQSNDFTRAEEINFLNPSTSAISGQIQYYTNPTVEYMSFSTSNNSAAVQRMRILGNGNVIIGTETSTACTLKVSSTKNGSESSPHFCITGTAYSALHWLDTNAYNIVTNSASRDIEIRANTNGVILTPGATAWASNSDIALKENINPLEDVLDKIKDYRCVEYNLKNSPEDKKIGFIAQDWVNDFSPIINKDKNDMLSMKYSETIPVLLKAIQELTAKVKELENK